MFLRRFRIAYICLFQLFTSAQELRISETFEKTEAQLAQVKSLFESGKLQCYIQPRNQSQLDNWSSLKAKDTAIANANDNNEFSETGNPILDVLLNNGIPIPISKGALQGNKRPSQILEGVLQGIVKRIVEQSQLRLNGPLPITSVGSNPSWNPNLVDLIQQLPVATTTSNKPITSTSLTKTTTIPLTTTTTTTTQSTTTIDTRWSKILLPSAALRNPSDFIETAKPTSSDVFSPSSLRYPSDRILIPKPTAMFPPDEELNFPTPQRPPKSKLDSYNGYLARLVQSNYEKMRHITSVPKTAKTAVEQGNLGLNQPVNRGSPDSQIDVDDNFQPRSAVVLTTKSSEGILPVTVEWLSPPTTTSPLLTTTATSKPIWPDILRHRTFRLKFESPRRPADP